MKPEEIATLLQTLQPATLAHMVADLQELQQDWLHYPEDAPPDPDRQSLARTLAELVKQGTIRARAADTDFLQLVEQIKDERHAADWAQARDSQEQDNWLRDFE
jgi:hypothetical protein